MLIGQWSGNPLGMNYDYAYADHLGNITGWSDAAGVYLSNSIALHEPFGAYRFRPPASVNPGISDRGFTGHRMNNSATNDLGLIYMNARYYLPEVGRFISADTIVPEPSNPQSYNRYAYVLNSPMNYTDPTGHRECGQDSNCQDILPGNPFQQALLGTWLYFKDNFDLPFEGSPSATQLFSQGSGGHNGVDYGGDFTVLAPADGEITRAGSTPSAGAGIWRIRNKNTREVREWSQFCRGGQPACNPAIRAHGTTNVPGPLELLATGEWEDIEPGWSHKQGTIIEINHERNLKTTYYHVEVAIEKGLTVDQGDVLGTTANIGWSTGIHMHYALAWNYSGRTISLDPLNPPSSIAHLLP